MKSTLPGDMVSVSCKVPLDYPVPPLASTQILSILLINTVPKTGKQEKLNKDSADRDSIMAIETKAEHSNHRIDEEKIPLLKGLAEPNTEQRNQIQKAISQTFQSTAHLANLLPTGTVLTFQLLSPILSNQGTCDSVGRFMTATLVVLCGLSCIASCFTDSFRDKNGNVCYGFVTFRGIWIIDGSATLPPELSAEYRLRFIDFFHALMSVLVFAAVALFDQNVVGCFYPTPSQEVQEILTGLPVGIGVVCSMLFVVFPTHRHGLGFPLSAK